MASSLAMFALAAAAAASYAFASGLVDTPIAGSGNLLQYLDGEAWTVSGSGRDGSPVSIGARVPGDLLTDLQKGGLIGDPLYELNFQDTLWDNGAWAYTTVFDVTPALLPFLPGTTPATAGMGKAATDVTGAAAGAAPASTPSLLLVFDSLKMAGDVYLNGQALGAFADQFLRYNYSVASLLQPKGNNLTVVFTTSADPRNAEGRWMACSGAWDWAPYGTTYTSEKDHTFSKGIVRSVYLTPVAAGGAAIAHVVPRIYYTGGYEFTPLTGRQAAPFNVTVDVVLYAPPGGTGSGGAAGTVSVTGAWAPSTPVSTHTRLGPGETVVSITLPPAAGVDLWYPLGFFPPGQGQPLYAITATFTPDGPGGSVYTASSSREVGFRVAHLCTVDDTHPGNASVSNGSGDFTMRFKVNGADYYARGANQIPVEEMEGRQAASTYTALLHSAAAAGHSMLRIWGGGVYLPPVFYDTADRLGITLYHDLMYGTAWFGGQGGTPTADIMQTAEITHAVRSLASHPSILIWNGGNEDLGRWDSLITSFLMPTLTAVDDTRAVWPTSPSYGWASGVNTLTGLPNGQPWVLPSQSGRPTIETHGPYQHGAGFKTVNGDGNLDLFPPNTPPALTLPGGGSAAYGAGSAGVFASEFGCSVFSSFESMAPTLAPQHWSAHAPPMAQRNYPTDNILSVYFGPAAAAGLNETGVFAFQRATYLATLGSALQQKSDIEARRAGNAWGTLTWQLGEIWPTGGWGSLEYGTVGYTPGQVLGGRWKTLHHWMASHLYRDQVLVCGGAGSGSASASCYIKNDHPFSVWSGAWATQLVGVADGAVKALGSGSVSLPRGGNAAAWVCADGKTGAPTSCTSWSAVLSSNGCAADGSDCVLMATLTAGDGVTVVDRHVMQLAPPAAMVPHLPRATLTATVASIPNADGSVNVTVTSAGGLPAWYVTLTTTEQGYFSDNAFALLPTTATTGAAGATTTTAGATASVTVALLPIPGATPIDPGRLQATLRVEHLALYLPVQ